MSGSARPLRVALLFAQFAAYHVDRCEAVARRLAGRACVSAVEVASRSRTYAWAESDGLTDAEKVTLFPGDDYEAVGALRRFWRQFSLLRRHDAVFIGISYAEPDIIALSWVLRLIGVRVFVMNDSKFDDHPRHSGAEWIKSLGLRAYRGAIVAGPRQRDYFRFLGFTRRPLLMGYDTVSVERLAAASAPQPGETVAFAQRAFLFVGRFVEKKNILALLEGYALHAIGQPEPRRLVLAGDGELSEAITARIAELGIEALVDRPGFLDAEAVARLMGRSLALVLVSSEEQWGLVVNEALASGLPVIVSDNVGARDALVRNLVNGFVVPARSAESLAAAMTAMAADEARWAALAEAARTRAWLGDVDRLSDAVETLLFPDAVDAAARAHDLINQMET